MNKDAKIWIAGASGMVGSAVHRHLRTQGYSNLITPSRQELDLLNKSAVEQFIHDQSPEVIIMAAAKVGGIMANSSQKVRFYAENNIISTNVIDAAQAFNVPKLIYLGSSCVYPKMAKQPMSEDELLTASLEPSNEPYALAKIGGIKFCEYVREETGLNYFSVMPTNLYGPGDNYHPTESHVLPALIDRFHKAAQDEASKVTLWGSGTPLREFMHVDDLADAITFLLHVKHVPSIINVGSGQEISIIDLAKLVAEVTGFQGDIDLDRSKPDGTPRKLMDSSKLNKLGWNPSITLTEGIKATYKEYLKGNGRNITTESTSE